MSSTRTSLVLGFAAGIPPEYFAPFAISLRESGYLGKSALFSAHYSEREVERLRQLFDVVIPVDSRFAGVDRRLVNALRWMRRTRRVRRAYPMLFRAAVRAGERGDPNYWGRMEYELEALQSIRYQLYLETLADRFSDATEILLTDVRDVLFQQDPFSPAVHELELFEEEPHVYVDVEPHNRKWLLNLYGRRELAAMNGRTVVCSGTTIGPRNSIVRYLRRMSEAVAAERRPMGSHDQGIHNYLVHNDRLGDHCLVRNGTGRVLTMGAMRGVQITDDGFVCNRSKTLPSVLHQYDRHEALARSLVAQFGTKTPR